MCLGLCGLPPGAGLRPRGWASLPVSKSRDVLNAEENFTHIYAVLLGKRGDIL